MCRKEHVQEWNPTSVHVHAFNCLVQTIAANENQKEASELAILISCVGRRLVLKQMVEEEVEVVRQTIGEKPSITGFYSYGEIAPFGEFSPCELHNQTMTITTLSEC